MKPIFKFIILVLAIPTVSYGSNIKDPLIANAFDVLMKGDFDRLKDYVMDLDKYKQVPGFKELLSGKDKKKTLESIKNLSFEKQKKNFTLVRGVFKELNFDFNKARLLNVIVQKPYDKNDGETRWIKFRDSDSRARLNVNYVIESEGNLAEFKLKSVYLLKGKRYLGFGYYLNSYRPSKKAKKSVRDIVKKYRLNGFIHTNIK